MATRKQEVEERIRYARKTGAEELDLSGLALTTIPDSIGDLAQLQSLNLAGNALVTVPAVIRALRSLHTLDLGDNEIEVLPDWIAELRGLAILYLEGNRLSRLPDALSELTALGVLWLGFLDIGNPLTRIPLPLRYMTGLIELRLAGCGIREVPEWLSELIQLDELDFRANELTDLPPAIADLPNLVKLKLEDNPLNPELAAANASGLDAVRAYLRARRQSHIVLDEAKLIVVGEGKVGKSSLLGALRGDPWIENRDTTHGVEIKPVQVTDPDTGRKITLNAWDFGGQPLYRPTHQLFFTTPAVYLVVWDPRLGPAQSAVEEWLKMVKHRAADDMNPDEWPRILIVATHGGPKERRDHIDDQGLRSQFGELIVGFHHVDSFTRYHLDELKTAIGRVAGALPHVGRTVATSWKKVLDAVRARGEREPYITYAEFESLCAGEEVGPDLARAYAAILHELGHIIHYADDLSLRDTIILKADWLSKAISFVLEDKRVKEQNGLVEHERLSETWNDPARPKEERYPAAIHPIFLRLMERFDLSYPVVLPERTDVSLVAQLVPGGRPPELGEDWPAEPPPGDTEKVQVCRIVDKSTKRPARAEGLLYRLIVRLHRYSLGRNDYRRSRHWQTGLLLDDTYNGRALFEELGGDVRITVRAAYPERLLHQFSEEVKLLVDDWKGLDCLIEIPCCPRPCSGSLEIEKLIKAKHESPKYPCNVCGTWRSIDALLATVGTPAEPLVSAPELMRSQAEIKAAVVNGFQSLSTDLRRMMSQADEQFAHLMQTLTDEAKEGPRLFSFLPADPKFLDRPKWTHAKFVLTLWCEHSRLPLPQLNGDGDTRGVYEIELPRQWLVKGAPFLRVLTGTLSLVLPVASSATKFMLDEATYKGIEEQLDLGQKSIEAAVRGAAGAEKWVSAAETSVVGREATRAEGGALRELHVLLKAKDPTFGGLLRVQNKRREFVWVHPRFAAEY
jgi:hypothetical protein